MDRRTLLAAAGAAAVLPHGIVRAQAFPSRPISIYVAFPAGGPTDQFFRAIAESASKILGQSVIVENKPGGGGTGRSEKCATVHACLLRVVVRRV